MRVGILTFHRAVNYGAALQCWALQTALEQMGFDAAVIDYENAFQRRFYSPLFLERPTPRKLAYLVYAFAHKRERRRRFRLFCAQNLHLAPADSLAVCGAFDAVIAGSDQIWNGALTGGDTAYLLPLVHGARRISYAASFGSDIPAPGFRDALCRGLPRFDALSVREPQAAALVQALCGRSAQVHVDPFFLPPRASWDALAAQSQAQTPEAYICAYRIHKSACFAVAQSLSVRTGLPVVAVKDGRTAPRAFDVRSAASPADFVRLMRGASYVVTDSFHGACAALVFERPFCVCPGAEPGRVGVRLDALLRLTGLSERISESDAVFARPVDFSRATGTLGRERERALRWLRGAITGKGDESPCNCPC